MKKLLKRYSRKLLDLLDKVNQSQPFSLGQGYSPSLSNDEFKIIFTFKYRISTLLLDLAITS
jgi:hypothetical protein